MVRAGQLKSEDSFLLGQCLPAVTPGTDGNTGNTGNSGNTSPPTADVTADANAAVTPDGVNPNLESPDCDRVTGVTSNGEQMELPGVPRETEGRCPSCHLVLPVLTFRALERCSPPKAVGLMTVRSSLSVVEVTLDSLRPRPGEPAPDSEAELEALTRSLKEFGFVQPVLARRRTNASAAISACSLRDASATRRSRSLSSTSPWSRRGCSTSSLNKISGDWDHELLARLLADLKPSTDIDLGALRLRRGRGREAAEVAGAPREAGARRDPSTSTPRWKPHVPRHAPNVATSGR